MIRLFRPTFDVDACLKELKECLEEGWTGPGFKTDQLEAEWKEYTGLKNAYYVNSCTAALNLTFDVLKERNGWQDGDEVISTAITFVSSNHAIMLAGLKPVFADVDDTLCLDPADVEKRITPKTKAVLFVGLSGNPGKYKEIREICTHHGLKLVVDAAHMAGTKENGKFPCQDADSVCFSFHTFKTLATADSGMLCFQDEENEKLARIKAWSGINTAAFSDYAVKDHKTYKWHYDVPYVSNCYNGNSIMAAVAIAQLHCLDKNCDLRRKICTKYDAAFSKVPQVKTVKYDEGVVPSRCHYQLIVEDRDGLVKFLNENGINSGVHYVSNINYRMYAYAQGTCPNSDYMSEHAITLPLHLQITEEETDKVIEKVIEYVTK